MKRSHAIFLGATGIILAGAYFGQSGKQRIDDAPSAEAPASARIYTSLDECIAANKPFLTNMQATAPAASAEAVAIGQRDCQRDFDEATRKHVQTAPKFSSQSDCEAQYGSQQCRSTTFNGTSVFVPAMVGFMVANALSANRNSQALLPPLRSGAACPPGQTPETMPGCTAPPRTSSSSSSSSSRSGGWSSYSTSSGHTVSRDTSKPAQQTVPIPHAAAAAPVARTTIGAVSAQPSSYARSSGSSSSSTVSRSGFGSTGKSVSNSSSS